MLILVKNIKILIIPYDISKCLWYNFKLIKVKHACCRCKLNAKEVEALYTKGSQSEADETTAILFVDVECISQLHLDTELWSDMAPSAKGCILLYQSAMTS